MPAPFNETRTNFNNIKPTIKGRIGVRVEGDNTLLLNLSRLKKFPKEGKTKVLQILASEFLNSLALRAPVDTGRYINSWRIKEQGADRIVVAPMGMLPPRPTITGGQTDPISAQQLARQIEFGTAPHQIAPRNKKHMVFLTKNGEPIITSKPVTHPGTKAIPHIRIALNETRRKAKGVVHAVAYEYADYSQWKDQFRRAAVAEGWDGHIPPTQTGRNRKDVSANIGRGTKANLKAKLSRPGGLTGTQIRRRGTTRIVGGFEKGGKKVRKLTQRKFATEFG